MNITFLIASYCFDCRVKDYATLKMKQEASSGENLITLHSH